MAKLIVIGKFVYETPMAQIMENDMKRYTIGLITGILLTASAFMFMGAAPQNEIGRYQISLTNIEGESWDKRHALMESVIDTKTGYIKRNLIYKKAGYYDGTYIAVD